MIRIAICDTDDNPVQNIVKKIRSELSDIDEHSFIDSTDLWKAIHEDDNFSLFLLDKTALEEYTAAKREKDEQKFLVRTQKQDIAVPFSSIVRVESYNRVLAFHLTDSSTLYTKCFRANFENILVTLLADERFLRLRKCCLINMSKVERVDKQSFVMHDGKEIRVPRSVFKSAKDKYMHYMNTIHTI